MKRSTVVEFQSGYEEVFGGLKVSNFKVALVANRRASTYEGWPGARRGLPVLNPGEHIRVEMCESD